jgi:hypothetical protein
MSEFDMSLLRPPTKSEAGEFAALGLTSGHWAALAPAPLFRADVRIPDRSDFRMLHAFRLFLRTRSDLAAEAELFWLRLSRGEVKGETLEIAYALLGWHLAHDVERQRKEEFLQLLDRTAQARRVRADRHVPIERDVRRWVDAYLPVAKYTRYPPLALPDPPDPAEVAKLLGRDLWKQMLVAPVAAALEEHDAEPEVAHAVVERLAHVSEADPFLVPGPLEMHLMPGWLRLFGAMLSPVRASSSLPLHGAMRIAARGLASMEFVERETILAALRKEIERAMDSSQGEQIAATWIDRMREGIEEELRAFQPRPGVVDAILLKTKSAPEAPPTAVKARAWQCGHCGIDNTLTALQCAACGLAAFPPLVLRSTSTGREEEVRTARRLGKQVFAFRLGDPDAKFASELQFELIRDETADAWVVRPLAGALNPTFYNGAPLGPAGSRLDDGGVISIGKNKLRLQVRLAH